MDTEKDTKKDTKATRLEQLEARLKEVEAALDLPNKLENLRKSLVSLIEKIKDSQAKESLEKVQIDTENKALLDAEDALADAELRLGNKVEPSGVVVEPKDTLTVAEATRLEELKGKDTRTPKEEAVRLALLDLKEKIEQGASQKKIDTARKAVEDAELEVK